MRIGIDARTLSYEYTGIPTYVHDVLMYWNEIDNSDEFYLYSNRPFKLDFELKENWHIVIDDYKLGTIWVQMRLASLIKKDNLDAFWEPMNFLPSKVKGVSYFVTVHDIAVYKNPAFGTFNEYVMERLFMGASSKRADTIIAISDATKKALTKELKAPADRITVIHNGDSPYNGVNKSYSDDEKKKIQNKWGITSADYLLFVGTIEPRKNIATIVKAFDVLKKEGSFTGKLVLAGKKGWKSEPIFQTIQGSPYRSDIVVTGYVSSLEKECLYREAKCLVFPSFEEGFGFPIVEAMSVGLPVVTTNGSSMPEVGGDVAWYVDENFVCDENALAKQIKNVINLSNEERLAYATKAKERALTFNRRDTAENLLKAITNNKM